MRLYTLTGASALDDPDFGHFDADANGAFGFPNELSDRLRAFHIEGKPAWEDDVERQNRLMREELERRKDPATLLDAVQQLVAAASGLPVTQAPEPVQSSSDPAQAGQQDPALTQSDATGGDSGSVEGETQGADLGSDSGSVEGETQPGTETAQGDDSAKPARKTAAKKAASKDK
ncbi:hypothetical protein ABZ883_40610 [Streptomyces sp. NPDC046977]|uniref:hypothetical protein n=1 Tax=Streptomyces sp. NPDC046977 TaxID=3154703 RepID=UPI0033C5ADDC